MAELSRDELCMAELNKDELCEAKLTSSSRDDLF